MTVAAISSGRTVFRAPFGALPAAVRTAATRAVLENEKDPHVIALAARQWHPNNPID
jgi:hypothetical protein